MSRAAKTKLSGASPAEPEGFAATPGYARRVLRHAATLLDHEARCLKDSFTIRGRWQPPSDDIDRGARASYDDMRATARKLRRLASHSAEVRDGGPMASDSARDAIPPFSAPTGSGDFLKP